MHCDHDSPKTLEGLHTASDPVGADFHDVNLTDDLEDTDTGTVTELGNSPDGWRLGNVEEDHTLVESATLYTPVSGGRTHDHEPDICNVKGCLAAESVREPGGELGGRSHCLEGLTKRCRGK